MVWGTFFPRVPGGVRACQDGLGHSFPRLQSFAHIEATHFKKGLPLAGENLSTCIVQSEKNSSECVFVSSTHSHTDIESLHILSTGHWGSERLKISANNTCWAAKTE